MKINHHKENTIEEKPATSTSPSDEGLAEGPVSHARVEVDKLNAAIDAACRALVCMVTGYGPAQVSLSENPGGGVLEKHWLGWCCLHAEFPVWTDEFPESSLVGLSPWILNDPDNLAGFIWVLRVGTFVGRLYALAGVVGESMLKKISAGEEPDLDEVMVSIALEWEDLSDTEYFPFPAGFESVDQHEVHALMQLLKSQWNLVLQIAEKLFDDELLDEDDLEKFSQIRVRFPVGIDLTDFNSWEISTC